jgi:hypothetical protein
VRAGGAQAGCRELSLAKRRDTGGHGAADVGDATAVRGGRPVGRAGQGSDGSERAAEVTAPA